MRRLWKRGLGELIVLAVAVAPPALVTAAERAPAAKDAAGWLITAVDGGDALGAPVAVAVDANSGRRFIAYRDAADEALRLAYDIAEGGNCGVGNRFRCMLIDGGKAVGESVDIAVHSDASSTQVHLAYTSPDDGSLNHILLKLWTTGLASISSNVVDDQPFGLTAKDLSLALDSNHDPHIAFQRFSLVDDNEVLLASYIGGGAGDCASGSDFDCETIATGDATGFYVSLAFTAGDLPRVAYYDGLYNEPRYAVRIAGNWSVSSVAQLGKDNGHHVALWIDETGSSSLAFLNATDETLIYAYPAVSGSCGNGAWQCDEISHVGFFPGHLALGGDADGRPVIAYHDDSPDNERLVVARPRAAVPGLLANCGPGVFPQFSWNCTTVDQESLISYLGDALDLAVDDLSGPVVAYHTSGLATTSVLVASQGGQPVFRDRFETGSSSWWSAVFP
jgi:hypothetical protein